MCNVFGGKVLSHSGSEGCLMVFPVLAECGEGMD